MSFISENEIMGGIGVGSDPYNNGIYDESMTPNLANIGCNFTKKRKLTYKPIINEAQKPNHFIVPNHPNVPNVPISNWKKNESNSLKKLTQTLNNTINKFEIQENIEIILIVLIFITIIALVILQIYQTNKMYKIIKTLVKEFNSIPVLN